MALRDRRSDTRTRQALMGRCNNNSNDDDDDDDDSDDDDDDSDDVMS